MAVNPLLVMSIDTLSEVSPFARTCQAAHLLGRVYTHKNEHADPGDVDWHYQEAHGIKKTASALLNLIRQEYTNAPPEERHKLFPAMALRSSSLLELFDIHCCVETQGVDLNGRNRGMRIELQQMAIDGFKQIAATFLEFAEDVASSAKSRGLDRISCLVLNSLYTAGATFAWYVRENGNQANIEALRKIREVLKLLEPRWQVAGELLFDS
jgi:hypothetical protein